MNTYVALLRGINVGTKNRIKMVDLKQFFESLGYIDVKTYIQSGNVIFKADEDNEEVIINKIEATFEERFQFSSNIILRTGKELTDIIRNCPFLENEIAEAKATAEGECFYVSLMKYVPSEDKIKLIDKYEDDANKYKIIGRDVFLLFSKSIRNSKLANNLGKLDVPSTVRNWNTINKLVSMLDEK
ncbi:DUF1697 domain-containing protein [Clostridium folliculivorans]|uniref:Cytoplasmic protein n=1 Tax=Clostridium folliculivorans TaxID=2886038 RepID=A0A9W5Y1S6_9CLOT|nr:DUF1697 domain-containing protein [Clostridium folliculivorans]GKU25063.1 hypothetical protein CFOLD11_18890 [Clostridium folliculivorans]GKU31161.1 hypothetical protein CFB3_32680 [Clostridium folliculivorans]